MVLPSRRGRATAGGVGLCILVATLGGVSVAASRNAGALDRSFSGDGRVTTDFGGADSQAHDVAIQEDGRIVAVGEADPGNVALARYRTSGNLDRSFGHDGKVSTDLGHNESGSAVAIQEDGRIVVAGFAETRPFTPEARRNFLIVRYRRNGNLDTSFGGSGRVQIDFGANETASDIAIQEDGRIVAAGTRTKSGPSGRIDDFAVARVMPNGALDRSFHRRGRVVTDLGSDYERAAGLALDDDGRIVVTGTSTADRIDFGSPNDFVLARYRRNGSLDRSFGGDGKVRTDVQADDSAESIVVQPNERLVVAGSTFNSVTSAFALVRYEENGTLDVGFGRGGRVVASFGADTTAGALDVALQRDGRIVAVGQSRTPVSTDDFALARYTRNGRLDRSFSGDGRVVTDFGGFPDDIAQAVALQADGRIVAAGGTDNHFAVARYLPARLVPDWE